MAKPPSGETSGGETSGGETSGGETSGGEPSGGETSGGETSVAKPPGRNIRKKSVAKAPKRGETSGGENSAHRNGRIVWGWAPNPHYAPINTMVGQEGAFMMISTLWRLST